MGIRRNGRRKRSSTCLLLASIKATKSANERRGRSGSSWTFPKTKMNAGIGINRNNANGAASLIRVRASIGAVSVCRLTESHGSYGMGASLAV